MKLVVGLGNPGAKYARHRHNVGFMAVERIADRHQLSSWRDKFQARASDGEITGVRCLVLEPQTYMNESGRAVAEACRFHKIDPQDVIVIHDELDLAPGKLKVKTGGGNAGHNGLRSISAHIGNEYVRVRVGIGHPGHKDAVHGYVLHDFSKADGEWLEPLLDAIASAAGHLVAGDASRFMTEIARLTNPEPPKSKSPDKPANAAQSQQRDKDAKSAAPAQEKPKMQAEERTALAAKLGRWLRSNKQTG